MKNEELQEFSVTLPPAEPGPARAAPDHAGPSPRPRRVLVVEDNEDAAESMRDVLEFGGHEVRVALDGKGGISAARSFHPEIVLCDIGLPGMSGYDVARALRADESMPRPLLVALSGYTSPEDVKRSLDAGFDLHIAKPATLEQLEEVLGSLRSPAG